jgi:tetratricopeptide (TPR) repeat protein
VPVDRDETLKKAEKLLKQGNLPGAIEEYVRLVEDRPRDWNLANALGDLYVKAGDMDLAAEQFTRVADHLCAEGFLPRAAAVYKKVLKVRSDDDHALWQLADIAGRQGLGVDARAHYGRLIRDRRATGNEAGALDCVVRLGQLQDADVQARTVASRILIERGESKQASLLMVGVADLLTKEGRVAEARDALGQAASLDPGSEEIQDRLAALGPVEATQEALAEPVAEAVAGHVEQAEAILESESVMLVALEEDPAAVLAQVVTAPDQAAPQTEEPLLLESVFEELTDRVARQQEARAREHGESGPDRLDE